MIMMIMMIIKNETHAVKRDQIQGGPAGPKQRNPARAGMALSCGGNRGCSFGTPGSGRGSGRGVEEVTHPTGFPPQTSRPLSARGSASSQWLQPEAPARRRRRRV